VTSRSSKSDTRCCKRCQRLVLGSYSRQDLIANFSIKELRQFLSKRNINTSHCVDKVDLVDLVLQRTTGQPVSGSRTDNIEHSRHIERLIDNMRSEYVQNIPPTRPPPPRPAAPPSPVSQPTSSFPQDSSPSGADQSERRTQDEEEDMDTTTDQSATTTAPNEYVNQTQDTVTQTNGTATPQRAKLSELRCHDDIECLTVKQLKDLLASHYVDYKGCVEKDELIERVERLWRDHSRNTQTLIKEDPTDSDTCRVCMDAIIDCILLECGHMVTCTGCGKRMAECPICRHYVSRVVHVFRA